MIVMVLGQAFLTNSSITANLALAPLTYIKEHQDKINLILISMFVAAVALILGKVIDKIIGKEKKKEVNEDEDTN